MTGHCFLFRHEITVKAAGERVNSAVLCLSGPSSTGGPSVRRDLGSLFLPLMGCRGVGAPKPELFLLCSVMFPSRMSSVYCPSQMELGFGDSCGFFFLLVIFA